MTDKQGGTMPSFDELYAECYDDDPQLTASAICADLKLNMRQRGALYHLVVNECVDRERLRVRRVERSASIGGRLVDPAGERAAFLREHFYNGTEYVPWATATVADHQGRIAYQMGLRNGIDADIARHQEAIDTILAHGVSCLGEIDTLAGVSS